jgi:uncharacterized OsmC-like protein
MPQLDSYLSRKQAAIQTTRERFTEQPEARTVTITASSHVDPVNYSRPTMMGPHLVVSDSGPALAGQGIGPSAPELLLGSLASCLVHTYLIHAVVLGVALDQVEVTISAALDYGSVIGMPADLPTQLQAIRYQARVESPASAQQIEALHEAVERGCPVLNTLRNPVSITRTP